MFKIIDNFYADPDGVRNFALSQEFNVAGNYPGYRTDCQDPVFRESIQQHLEGLIGEKITYFPEQYNTQYQFTTEHDRTWVHHDGTKWAAVVYLTPGAPLESGTGIYQHIETGIMKHHDGQRDFNNESTHFDDWEIAGFAGNVYNRMVLYHGAYYHRSVIPGFGTDKFNGRLFQTFFFDSE